MHQGQQPDGYPYAFIPSTRYDPIRQLHAEGKWMYCHSRTKTIARFNKVFIAILKKAGITPGQFYDLRRTAIGNWFREELSELEIMKLAGHTICETTHRYYLKVSDDSVDRARQASAQAMSRSGTLGRTPTSPCDLQDGHGDTSACSSHIYSNAQE